jgi:16S rRNA (cytidine1402-2'-O)-methyltransferase
MTTVAPKGRLYLLPNALGDGALTKVIPGASLDLIRSLRYLIAENPKSARQFLKRVEITVPLQDIRIERLDEHTPAADLSRLLAPLISGTDGGMVSEAGCPAVADPGAPLIKMAHEQGLRVVPLVGPSSIMLALMASGLEGQRFAFHGYLPVEEAELSAKLRELEKESRRLRQTQVFIETPYRNERLLKIMLGSLRDATWVCVATNLSLESETVVTRIVQQWKRAVPASLKDQPSVFLLQA